MELWQFSVFFAALLVGYLLLHLRVARFEQHLRKLHGIDALNEKLGSLREALPPGGDDPRFQRLERLLEQLHEDLEDLRETTSEVGHAVVQIPAPAVSAPLPAGAPVTGAERIRSAVEIRLLQLGYSQLRLLSDLRELPVEGDVEVQVECARRHMPFKGRVLVRNGAVCDLALQTVAPTFP